MKSAGVKKQFTKLQVLTTILPQDVIEQVKPLLKKQESEFTNNDSYKLLKTKIFSIFGAAEEDPFERAMGRVLSGLPSQLARKLVNDLCDHELVGCCCHKFIFGQWRRSLPTSVRQGIAHMQFRAETFDEITKLADKIYNQGKSSAQISVAAVSPESHQNLLETGFHQMWPGEATQEVAAVTYWRGRGSRGRTGNRGGQRGGRGTNHSRGGQNNSGPKEYSASNPRWTGPRHPDMPPFSSCRKHWDWGKSARFCQEPWSCPWKNFFSQPAKNGQQ